MKLFGGVGAIICQTYSGPVSLMAAAPVVVWMPSQVQSSSGKHRPGPTWLGVLSSGVVQEEFPKRKFVRRPRARLLLVTGASAGLWSTPLLSVSSRPLRIQYSTLQYSTVQYRNIDPDAAHPSDILSLQYSTSFYLFRLSLSVSLSLAAFLGLTTFVPFLPLSLSPLRV